jgi:flagellar motility protein MotE (MotC chaperone)
MATKEATKAANEQENEVQETSSQKKNSSLPNIIMAVLLVVLLSLPLILTRLNVLGAGDALRPILKTNSIFKYFLPPVPNSNDVSTMSRQELMSVIDKDKAQIAALQNQIKILQQISEVYTGSSDGMQKFEQEKSSVAAAKQQIENDKRALAADRAKFSEQVKNADRASFEEYYKKISPATAQKLYEESIKADAADNMIKGFVSYYEKMDSSSAAKIFEKLSFSDPNLVVNILYYMDKGKGTKILQAMDPKISSGISYMLAKKVPIS